MNVSRTQTRRPPSRAGNTDGPSGAAAEQPNGLRQPRQDRSRASLERVLAAGAELLVERGYEAFTIAAVGQRANASTGLIYTRFKNKAALFEAVLLREQERMVTEEAARFAAIEAADLCIEELIEQLVRELAGITHREAKLTQVFMERTTVEPALLEHVKRMRTTPRDFARMLLDRRDELCHPDPERAADMAFWLANSALERRVHTPMWRHWDSDAADDWDEFVDDLIYAVNTFLLSRPAASTGASTNQRGLH